MSAPLLPRVHGLADALVRVKSQVRTALATELATALGTAVRDVVVIALVDRLVAPARPGPPVPSVPRPGAWRDDGCDRDRDWDPWDEPGAFARDRTATRFDGDDGDGSEPARPVPVAAAVVAGVHVGRWWLARRGSVPAALGLGAATAALGLAGGPVARAALAVLAAAGDVLTAEAALGRADPS